MVACHPKQGVVAVGFTDGLVLLVRTDDGAEVLAPEAGRRAGHGAGVERERQAARLRDRERRGRHPRSGEDDPKRGTGSDVRKVTADRRVVLEDRDNFRAFKLVVEGRREDIDAIRDTLQGTAEMPDADTAWMSQDALRRSRGGGRYGVAAVARRDDREGAATRLDRRGAQGDQGACGMDGVILRRSRTQVA